MEDKALFGGNISGRRLRGVKINPIYQGNEPGVRECPPLETQSESALPIGEIQIEVYDSLPRSGQRPFRQSRSSPVIPGRESAPGEGGGGGGAPARPGRDAVEDVRMSPTVSSAMDVGNIPWTFLQDRSPVQRQPVWGAFWGTDTAHTPSPSSLHPPHPEKTDRQSIFETRSKSSSSLFAVPSADDIDVIEDAHSDESVGSGKNAGGEESSGKHNPATQEGAGSSGEDAASTPNQNSVTGKESSAENVNGVSSQPSSGMEKNNSQASLSSNNYVYSDFVHFAEHNCHHYSGFDNIFPKSEKRPNPHYPVRGGNGISVSRPGAKNPKCPCLCHSRKHFQDSVSGLAVTDLTNIEKTLHQISESGEAASGAITQKGCCPSKSTPDLSSVNSAQKEKNRPPILSGKAGSLPDVKVAPHTATNVEQGNVCILNLRNNDQYSVVFRTKTDSSSQFSEQLEQHEMSDDVFVDDNEDEDDDNSPGSACERERSSINGNGSEGCETVRKNDDSSGNCSSRDVSSSNSHTGVSFDTSKECDFAHRVCKLCGCLLEAGNRGDNVSSAGGVTSSQQSGGTNGSSSETSAANDVPSLLGSESILLRADELNAPAYLQRYLLEAQKHFMQQQQDLYRQSGNHDPLPPPSATTDPSSTTTSTALPIADNAETIPPELLDFLVKEDNFVPESFLANGDAVSVVEEELHSARTKTPGWKKSFKSSTGSGNSKAASKPSSKANSRQSSRNSRTGKHSSIEDLDAEDDDGWLEGVGSLWGGSSSNRSNSIVDRNENLKKKGLSIIHIEGTSTDPGFEMIVPYDEADEEDSNYSSRRRRQRREELAEYHTLQGEKASLRQRLLKAGLCTLIFGVIIGIFIGVVVHFSKDAATVDDSGTLDGGLIGGPGGFHAF